MAYYHRAMKPGLPKFVRFAKNVWNIKGDGMTDEQIAEAGLEALKNWMLEDKTVALARVCPAGTHMTEISIGRVECRVQTVIRHLYARRYSTHQDDLAYFIAGLILVKTGAVYGLNNQFPAS